MKKLIIALLLFAPFLAKADVPAGTFFFMDNKGYDISGVQKYFCFLDNNCYDLNQKLAFNRGAVLGTSAPAPTTTPSLVAIDWCSNLPGNQESLPAGFYKDANNWCFPQATDNTTVVNNPQATDTGDLFCTQTIVNDGYLDLHNITFTCNNLYTFVDITVVKFDDYLINKTCKAGQTCTYTFPVADHSKGWPVFSNYYYKVDFQPKQKSF